MGTEAFTRKTRRPGPTASSDEIELQPPPAVPENTGGAISSVLLYAPMALSSLAMVLMFVRPGSGPLAWVGAGLMLVAAVGMLLAQMMRSGVEHKQKLHGDRRDYVRYLGQVRLKMRGALVQQRKAALWVHPHPGSLWSMVMGYRLWERRPSHEDFGEVRIGLGKQRSSTKLLPPESKPLEDLEPLSAHALRRFIRAYSTLDNAPTAVYLRGFARLQFQGGPEEVRGLVRAMLSQLATAHGPGDALVAMCVSDEARDHWDWVKWLPHNQDAASRDATGTRRLVTDSISELEQLLGGSEFTEAGRRSSRTARSPRASRSW